MQNDFRLIREDEAPREVRECQASERDRAAASLGCSADSARWLPTLVVPSLRIGLEYAAWVRTFGGLHAAPVQVIDVAKFKRDHGEDAFRANLASLRRRGFPTVWTRTWFAVDSNGDLVGGSMVAGPRNDQGSG